MQVEEDPIHGQGVLKAPKKSVFECLVTGVLDDPGRLGKGVEQGYGMPACPFAGGEGAARLGFRASEAMQSLSLKNGEILQRCGRRAVGIGFVNDAAEGNAHSLFS